MKGFIGFEVKEDISLIEEVIKKTGHFESIFPYISIYEFDFSALRIEKLIQDLKSFQPISPLFESQYNRRKKRFNHYGKRENNFWYDSGSFTTDVYAEDGRVGGRIIIPKDDAYLKDIFRPVLIHGKLPLKECQPYWCLSPNEEGREQERYVYSIRNKIGNPYRLKIPEVTISLDELGVFVGEEKVSSVYLEGR
ncbi:MAG: hypothetical protein KC535_04825 [Nanoarchaeota archaeon]|nr:hypothetical protein [Nanoarchaeota archaeon]